MTSIILALLFVTVIFIVIGVIISYKSSKNAKARKDDATYIPPYMIGDSNHKHDHDSNDSFGGFDGGSGGDGGGGGGGD